MRILISGSSGLIGSFLAPYLADAGHDVVRLLRSPAAAPAAFYWNPAAGQIHAPSLEGFDAVVHLAGENVASARWSAGQKRRIRESRVGPTRLLSEALARLEKPPRVMISASAIGYYGDRGGEVLDEASGPGAGFLAEVCRAWEQATSLAEEAGVRVIHLRNSIVLSSKGGALAKMLKPFRLGLGGVVGSGRQYMSWIEIDDLAGAIQHCLENEDLSGPVLAASPHPVTNREFTKTLGRVLLRPAPLPMPAFLARAAFGEMADALLLSSARVRPARLLSSGYGFRFPDLEPALRHLLAQGTT